MLVLLGMYGPWFITMWFVVQTETCSCEPYQGGIDANNVVLSSLYLMKTQG